MTDSYSLLIIGGGPAGFAAARAYRELVRDGSCAIVSDEQRMPYRRPPLTKELLRGESAESDLPLEPEGWLWREHVDLIGGRAVALDADARVASLSGGRELPYAQCVLATGAEPTRLPVPGSDQPRVRVLRTIDQLRELLVRLGDDAAVVVIGSGFIGCEIASSLRSRGHRVALVSDEPAPNVARLGPHAAAHVRAWLDEDGIELHLGSPVERIEMFTDAATVIARGQRISGDIVVMATGVSPRSELAAQAGLALDDGAIPTSAAMRTKRAGLLAAGDVCKAQNLAAGRALRVEHWGDALEQGQIAGKTAAGAHTRWSSVPGFWSTIGRRTLKYAAWGDGFDQARLEPRGEHGFAVWYSQSGALVGVLTHDSDEDYERGMTRVAEGAAWGS